MLEGRPIFVVGAPRTGTTLVKEILNRHPEVHLFDEVHFFERIWDDRDSLGDLRDVKSAARAIERVRDITTRFGSDKDVPDVLTPEAYAARLAEEGADYRALLGVLLATGAGLRGASVWGDSSPQDVLYLPTLREWFPEARFIGVARDPRGFLSSYKNYYRRGEPSYRESYNPVANSMLWKSYMTALLEAKRSSWGEAVHVMHYEALVSDPERAVRALCAHVGVDYRPELIDVSRMNSSFEAGAGYSQARGIFATSKDRWREELTPTEIWLGEKIFRGPMKELGYVAVAGENGLRPSPVELARIVGRLPARVFNLVFRSGKPFKAAKLKRVLGLFRSR